MKDLVIVYYSKTNMSKRFLEKVREHLDIKCYRITESANFVCHAPFVMVTPTYDYGRVPEQVTQFLEEETNRENMQAVVSSGNKNWGAENFARAGKIISEQHNVPWLHKLEMQGNSSDVKKVTDSIKELKKELKERADE